METKNFLGLEGLKHFWTKAKTWIAGQITAEVTSRENADTALQQSITDLEASVDEKIGSIGSIDISAALSHIKQYDFVVDSNETLLAWANCTDGSMKSVLVKSGEYKLGKEINLVNAGTKFVFAEDGNKITVLSHIRGIGATLDYGAVIIGLNVEVIKSDRSCFVFYGGMICYNCTGTGNSNTNGTGIGFRVTGTGFSNCTCSNCTGTGNGNGTGNVNGIGFSDCTCSNCTGTGTGNSNGNGYGFINCACSNCTGTGTGTGNSNGNGYGFNNCTCSNCTGTGTGNSNGTGKGNGYGFSNCTCCSNCTGTGTGTGKGYGFYFCKHCSSCRAGKKSTTATWGGTNAYIDSDSCDYVAS